MEINNEKPLRISQAESSMVKIELLEESLLILKYPICLSLGMI